MQTFTLDLSVKRVIPLLHAKQRDVGTKILIKLTDNKEKYTVPDGVTWTVWYSGASGEGNYDKIDDRLAVVVDANAGTATVELIYQMLDNPGPGEMCLVMNSANGTQLGLWNIPYWAEALPGADSKAATAYYNAFLQARKGAEDAAAKSEAAAGRSEAAAEDAKEAAKEAANKKPQDVIVTATFDTVVSDTISTGAADTFAYDVATAISKGATVTLIDDDNRVYKYDGYRLEPNYSNAFFKAQENDANGITTYTVNINNEGQASRTKYTREYGVLYIPQDPTPEQQAHARKNVAALAEEAVCVSYEQPTDPEARVWVNPNGAVGDTGKKTETNSTTTVASIVGLALNEMLNNTAARYATIQDAHDGASATADGKVLAYTCGGALNIMLLDNLESASVINITKDCTLHLNGKKLTFTAAGAYLNITTASKVTINGEVAGSEITMNLSNGLNDKLVSVTDTTLHMVGGTYSMYGTYATAAIAIRCETTSTRVEMDGCSFNSDIDFAQGAYAVQVYGDCEMEHCSINAITRDVKYCYPINTNSKSNTFRIANSSINVKCSKVGGLVRGISVFSKVATIENCRITADGYGDVSASEVCAVCAINSGENTLLTINGGYYYGAREALGIHGEVKINGGVYAGSQHGGGYMSAPAIKAQNAIFRNVEYTGDCGWDDAHFGAVYCGDSDSNADVSFDNCRFESKNHATQGITAKYINTKVYLSNCVIDGNFGQDLRADATCTIYVGKNVEYDTVFENGGTIDTTTYADQEFGFETETTTSHALLSVKDERGNWVGIA